MVMFTCERDRYRNCWETANERARGRRFNTPPPEFGECVMFSKALPKKAYNNMEAQWESGVYLGVNELSQELIIGTSEGVVKATEFRHKGSEEEMWNLEEITKIQSLNTFFLRIQHDKVFVILKSKRHISLGKNG